MEMITKTLSEATGRRGEVNDLKTEVTRREEHTISRQGEIKRPRRRRRRRRRPAAPGPPGVGGPRPRARVRQHGRAPRRPRAPPRPRERRALVALGAEPRVRARLPARGRPRVHALPARARHALLPARPPHVRAQRLRLRGPPRAVAQPAAAELRDALRDGDGGADADAPHHDGRRGPEPRRRASRGARAPRRPGSARAIARPESVARGARRAGPAVPSRARDAGSSPRRGPEQGARRLRRVRRRRGPLHVARDGRRHARPRDVAARGRVRRGHVALLPEPAPRRRVAAGAREGARRRRAEMCVARSSPGKAETSGPRRPR